MKKTKFLCGTFFISACLVSTSLMAKPFAGVLVDGGGVDDLALDIKNAKGEVIHAYCQQSCGDWFSVNRDDVSQLKKIYKNKPVNVDVFLRANQDEIAGPASNEKLLFIRKIDFVDKNLH